MSNQRPDRDQDLTATTDRTSGPGRFTVRRRLPDGAVGDVIGHLLSADDEIVLLRDRDGGLHRIRRVDILASRRVPDQPPKRRTRS